MKQKKLKELNLLITPLNKEQKLKIKGGVGDNDVDVMIGSDCIDPTYIVIEDIDSI